MNVVDDSAVHTKIILLLFYYFIGTSRHKGLRFNYQTS